MVVKASAWGGAIAPKVWPASEDARTAECQMEAPEAPEPAPVTTPGFEPFSAGVLEPGVT